MFDLIELVVGIIEAWYIRRFLAAAGAVVLFWVGIPMLLGLPSSEDSTGDLVIGLGCVVFALLFAIAAIRTRKPQD